VFKRGTFAVMAVVVMAAGTFFCLAAAVAAAVVAVVVLFAPGGQQFLQQRGEGCLFLRRQTGKHLPYKLAFLGGYARRFCAAGFGQGYINGAFIRLVLAAEDKAV
jgi:hypothetical protein